MKIHEAPWWWWCCVALVATRYHDVTAISSPRLLRGGQEETTRYLQENTKRQQQNNKKKSASSGNSKNDTYVLEQSSSNMDIANATNVTECPVIGPAVTCAIEYAPVLCNSLCYYDNECTAAGAGWNTQQDCSPVKSSWSMLQNLTGSWMDVLLAKDTSTTITESTGHIRNCLCHLQDAPCTCSESSPSTATAATTTNTKENAMDTCPMTIPLVLCLPSVVAYTCGSCTYAGRCEARYAGWNVTQDCTAMSISNLCHNPPTNHSCSTVNIEPVLCGNVGCVYDNLCLSVAAGWPADLCGSVYPSEGEILCKCPASTPDCCDTIQESLLNATDVSVEPAVTVQDINITDTAPVTVCKTPAVNNTCSTANKPVSCGNVGCVYDNLCLSVAAGWPADLCTVQPTDNSPVQSTPVGVAPATPVQTGISPQKNTTAQTNNSTSNTSSSSPEPACPVPTGMCTMEYAPVACSSRGSTTRKCQYSNACKAVTAGFDVAKECAPNPMG
jgi:hypothetical protein